MFFQYITLGVVQGLTEFLPVSSSGHLVLGQSFLNVDMRQSVLFEVCVHLSTLLAVVCVFHAKIRELIFAPFQRNAPDQKRRIEMIHWWKMIIAGTVVTGFVGVVFEDTLKSMFEIPMIAAVFLFITGVILFATKFFAKRDGRSIAVCAIWVGFMIGLVQAFALLPGISRSGSTIAVAIYLGVRRDDAGEFSFLLSIPSILGAAVLELRNVDSLGSELIMPIVAGCVAAFVVGYFSLKILMQFVREGHLHYFSWYCWILSVVSIAWLVMR